MRLILLKIESNLRGNNKKNNSNMNYWNGDGGIIGETNDFDIYFELNLQYLG